MLDVLVLSDIHLGGHLTRLPEVASFFRQLPSTRLLVLDGDLWDATCDGLTKEEIAILSAIVRIRRTGTRVVLISGNHDPDQSAWATLMEIPPEDVVDHIVVESGGKHVFITHGHQWDPELLSHPRLTEFAITAERTLAAVHAPLARWVKRNLKIDRDLLHTVRYGALDFRRCHDYDAVICGHTHIPDKVQPDSQPDTLIYVNSGSWVESVDPTYVTIENGKLELRTYKP
jgi:UDP-2,3-diacylglucosamine pyrophosphatase LpxH